MRKQAHFVVSGRVQGVCYRMYARERAEALGLTGWVRNRADGTVELVAEGEERALTELADWCRAGPPHARVQDVRESYSAPNGGFKSFEISF